MTQSVYDKENVTSMENTPRKVLKTNVHSSPYGVEKTNAEVIEVSDDAVESVSEVESKSEPGVIEEIYCENFMCHRKMRIKLSKNINFITGENGSGKSAIIAALQVCLGATARSTHRATSIKNLIRNGHDGFALVRIVLLNDNYGGSDAYRFEDFGKRIIVERVIHRSGGTEYRLKSSEGKIVSKRRKDLDTMLDHLNIQIDNPCAVLDQENAKSFLKGDARDKYKFFLKATDLFETKNTYMQIREETSNMDEIVLQNEREKLNALEIAKDDACRVLKEAQEMGQLESIIDSVKKQLAWAFVQEHELERDNVVLELKEEEQKCTQFEDNAQFAQKLVVKLENQVDIKTKEIDEHNGKVARLNQEKLDCRAELNSLRKPISMAKSEADSIRKRVYAIKSKIQSKTREIQNMVQEYQNRLKKRQQNTSPVEEDIAQKQQLVNEYKDEKLQQESALEEIDDMRKESNIKLEQCDSQMKHNKRELQRVLDAIRKLEYQKKNALAMYGDSIPKLLQLIEQNKRNFSQIPIGPMGIYVKLPEDYRNKATAFDLVVGSMLNSFLVANGRDKALLSKLRHQAKCASYEAKIIITKRLNARYNSVRSPDGSLAQYAMSNILQVSDDNVYNALVDMTNMESKLIFGDRNEAENAIFLGTPGKQYMPPHVSEAYISNGDKMYIRNGNMAYIPNKRRQRRSPLENANIDHVLQSERNKIEHLENKDQLFQRDYRQLRQTHNDTDGEWKRISKELNHSTSKLNRLNVQLSQLQRQKADQMEEEELDTSPLEERKLEYEKDLMEQEERLRLIQERITEHNPAIDKVTHSLTALHEELDKVNETLEGHEKELSDLYDILRSHKEEYLVAQKHLKYFAETISVLKSNIQEMEEQLEQKIAMAQKFCKSTERLQVSESATAFGKQLQDLQARLVREKARFDGLDLLDLEMQYEDKRIKFEKKTRELESFTSNSESLATMLHERKSTWKALRKIIASNTNQKFNSVLQDRDFSGKLRFNYKEETINIEVVHNVQGADKGCAISDMKSLSGGERSYCQVSLLLALSQTIECPFRVMDEFDVFMDSMNRVMTLQLLISSAKREGSRQFIFITPNDLSSIDPDPMIKIQKLEAPRY